MCAGVDCIPERYRQNQLHIAQLFASLWKWDKYNAGSKSTIICKQYSVTQYEYIISNSKYNLATT